MTASITFGPRHPAYMAGYTWVGNPTAPGCPYERGTDDYAMWQMGVEDACGREAALREAARECADALRMALGLIECGSIIHGLGCADRLERCEVVIRAAIAKMEGVL